MKRRGIHFSLPRGFQFAATACGLRKGGGSPSGRDKLDLALIAADRPVAAAGLFTTNLIQAAPVQLSREHLRRSSAAIRGVVVNAGNANCATGPAGRKAAKASAERAARALGCRTEQVLVCSTGVIGVPLRVERIVASLDGLARSRAASPGAFAKFSRAILTTDTHPKRAAGRCRIGGRTVRLLGCAKGAGMIHPRMATMLAFVVTDATASPRILRRALGEAAAGTFNAITVDGDTSTNDTLLLFASGASGCRPIAAGSRAYRQFVAALEKVCRALALAIVADGEGAKRVVEIEVRGARSASAAERVARTIAGSPLVKTALAGADPNWGRILAAAGRAGERFDPARVEIRMGGMLVCRRGAEHPFDERRAHRRLLGKFVPICVDLNVGHRPGSNRGGRARVWTCDFTAQYVRINASYRT